MHKYGRWARCICSREKAVKPGVFAAANISGPAHNQTSSPSRHEQLPRAVHVNMPAVSTEEANGNDDGTPPGDGAGASAAAPVIVDVNAAGLEWFSGHVRKYVEVWWAKALFFPIRRRIK